MAQLANTPQSYTVLRLAARKSFVLNVAIVDHDDRALDLTGCTLTLVAKGQPFDYADSDDSDNLLAQSEGVVDDPATGFARFDIQAADLFVKPGEYPFALTLHAGGYSALLVFGVFDVQDNAEFESVNDSFTSAASGPGLKVVMQDQHVIKVLTGIVPPPGTHLFTTAERDKLAGIETNAQRNVADWLVPAGQNGYIANKPAFGTAAFENVEDIAIPPGGSQGAALVKRSSLDGDTIWAQVSGGGGGALDATGVTAGYVPTASGVDTWDWEEVVGGVETVNGYSGNVTLDADDINESSTRVWYSLDHRTYVADQIASGIDYNNLLNTPTLGSAAAADTTDFLPSTGIPASATTSGVFNNARIPTMSGLRGLTDGTTAPVGGSDGDYYFQYTV